MSETAMHIVPQEQHWALTRPGHKTPVSLHESRKEAVEAGHRAVHESGGGHLLVLGRDGLIRDRIHVMPVDD